MSSEAGFGTAAVRYTSVDTGFRGPSGPRTVGEPATDGHGPAHGRERKRPRTGPAGAVMQTALTRIPALTCHFRMPALCRRHPRHRSLARCPGCRGPRRCAGWLRWPGCRCSGRRSLAGPRRRARLGPGLPAAPGDLLRCRRAPEFGDGKVFRPNRDVRFSAGKSRTRLTLEPSSVPAIGTAG